jgi:hypothetical protein
LIEASGQVLQPKRAENTHPGEFGQQRFDEFLRDGEKVEIVAVFQGFLEISHAVPVVPIG